MLKRLFSAALVTALVAPMAMARTYDTSDLPYRDADWDLKTSLAVSLLTDVGLIEGYSDNTFRAYAPVNRAEFLHVAMNTLIWTQVMPDTLNCFPDVREGTWFALDVCRAKQAGIVEGVMVPGSSQKYFQPARGVTYAEALKMMTLIHAIEPDHVAGAHWYDTYLRTAERMDLDLDGARPTDALTRGGMARLIAGFWAYNENELDLYRDAEAGRQASSARSSVRSSARSSASSLSRSSVRSGLSKSSTSSRASLGNGSFASVSANSQGAAFAAVRSNFLLLGELSPPVAGFNVFSNLEPVDLDSVTVTLVAGVDSLDSFNVYDEAGRMLGRATRVSDTVYTLNVPSNTLELPRREDMSFYVRAQMKREDSGGESGEELRVSEIRVEGDGQWSNESYGESSDETFSVFVTARGIVDSISAAGPVESTITPGLSRLVGEFRFEGKRTDSLADIRLTSLAFQIESSGEATLSNPEIRVAGSDASSDCTVSSSVITCAALPASVGELDDGEKTLRVYADVTLASNADDPYFRLTLNDPGSPSENGSVTWTDGDTVFTWLPVDAPIARGTLYR
jgi:hypothetical protein